MNDMAIKLEYSFINNVEVNISDTLDDCIGYKLMSLLCVRFWNVHNDSLWHLGCSVGTGLFKNLNETADEE